MSDVVSVKVTINKISLKTTTGDAALCHSGTVGTKRFQTAAARAGLVGGQRSQRQAAEEEEEGRGVSYYREPKGWYLGCEHSRKADLYFAVDFALAFQSCRKLFSVEPPVRPVKRIALIKQKVLSGKDCAERLHDGYVFQRLRFLFTPVAVYCRPANRICAK